MGVIAVDTLLMGEGSVEIIGLNEISEEQSLRLRGVVGENVGVGGVERDGSV